jgi:transposase-like protein
MEAEELKQELARVDRRRGHKYPEQLRDAAVALSHRNKSLGKSLGKTAEELGMSVQTLSYWRALARDRRNKMTPVAIVDDESRQADALIVECGQLRVSGLSLADVVELLRMLA